MVFRKRLGGVRRRRRGGLRKRMGMRKRISKRNPNNIGGPNTCKVVETLPTQTVNLNTPYLFVKTGITGARAPAIAKEFGLYRIAKITFTHRPLWDTYNSSLPGVGNSPNSLPTLYWKMCRYGDAPPAFNGDYMRALGAKPFRLDDKQVTVAYKPNILYTQENAAGQTASSIKITPWLSTDDTPQDAVFTLSTAEHYGHTLFIEGGGAGSANGTVANLDIQIVYEFKNPRLVPASSVDLSGNQVVSMSV